ncbi:MAG: RHS repeat-associated core domain-containing protein [Pseudomonadota bacterium]
MCEHIDDVTGVPPANDPLYRTLREINPNERTGTGNCKVFTGVFVNNAPIGKSCQMIDDDGNTYWTGYDQEQCLPDFCVADASQVNASSDTNLSSGASQRSEQDWASSADSRLNVNRSYTSQRSTSTDMGAWASGWSRRSYNANGQIRFERPNGNVLAFQDQAPYAPVRAKTKRVLTKEGADWLLEDGNGRTERYAASGEIVAETWPDGYELLYAYGANGGLTSITDNRDQSLTITTDGTTVAGITARPWITEILIDHDVSESDGAELRLTYDYAVSGTGAPPPLLTATISDIGSAEAEILSRYEYARGILLSRVEDGLGAEDLSLGYDAAGTVTHLGSALESDRYIYVPGAGGTVVVTNPLGLETTYSFEAVDGRRLVKGVTTAGTNDPDGSHRCLPTARSLDYTPAPAGAPEGYVYERVERNGSVTRFERDSRGLVTRETEDATGAAPRVTDREWHPSLRLPAKITTSHLEERFAYDADGLLLSYTQRDVLTGSPSNGAERVWTFTYTTLASGLKVLASVDGPETADTTAYTYDADGQLLTTTTPTGLVTTILERDALGNASLVETPDGIQTLFVYDFRSRLIRTIRDVTGGAYTTEMAYDDIGQLTTLTTPRGGLWNYTYDDARRLIFVENPHGDAIAYAHDEMGNVTITEYRGADDATTFRIDREFDELGRILRSLGAENQLTRYLHDVEDNLVETIDPLGETQRQSFDALNRAVSLTNERGYTTDLDYDRDDRLTRHTDANAIETGFAYNGFGELVTETSADRGTRSFTHDARGLVTQMTDGRGVAMTYAYDGDGRLTARTFPSNATEDVGFEYGLSGIARGRLTRITDEAGEIQRSYNSRGLVARETRLIDGIAFDTDYTYAADDSLASVIYPSGREILYATNTAGEITGISMRTSPSGVVTDLATAVDYAPFGPLTRIDYPGGLSLSQSLDGSYRLTGQRLAPSSGAALRDVRFGYDARDDLASIDSLLDDDDDWSFARLADGTLAGAVRGDRPGQSNTLGKGWQYSYDAIGNRTYLRIRPSADHSFLQNAQAEHYFMAPGTNRLATIARLDERTPWRPEIVSYAYDGAGNTVSVTRQVNGTPIGGFVYGYNEAGRLAEVRRGVPGSGNEILIARYTYNALGQQVVRRDLTTGLEEITLSVHDLEGRRLAEYAKDPTTGAVTLLREYIWLDGWTPFAVIEDGDVFYLAWDKIQRPVLAFDTAGNTVWQARYAPFGALDEIVTDTRHLTTQELRFPGQWFQPETGLHQNWHRDYDPRTGRYLQADPLGLVDGPSVYGYALQRPHRYFDPYGLQATTADGPISRPAPGTPGLPQWMRTCIGILGRMGGAVAYILVPSTLGHPSVPSTCDGMCDIVLNEDQNEKRKKQEQRDKRRKSAPTDKPRGTKAIDKVRDLSSQNIHDIKDGIQAGPDDWVGISGDGDVITTDPETGLAENHGPHEVFLP